MKCLKVAFVGMRRPPSDLPKDYLEMFVKYHMELPWYFASESPCDVHLTFVEPVSLGVNFSAGGSLLGIQEHEVAKHKYDVIVHWRKWFPELYKDEAINVILSQDHSYGDEWKATVSYAYDAAQLDGILVFPTWHKEQVARELAGRVPTDVLYDGLTLGVDCMTYYPGNKDPYHLLWASDPGRGLVELIPVFLALYAKDKRFRLTVTYPDYVKAESLAPYAGFFNYPGVRHLRGVKNGLELWGLFNDSGVLPYTSTFPEPSSRCHRQAMAAGSLVLYPPNMGSPSHLIENNITGIIAPTMLWPEIINDHIKSGRWSELGQNARSFAKSEDWRVQANRFYNFFKERV